MKKIICALIAVMLLALLTACGCSTDANVEGEAGDNGRMYNDSTYDGNNNDDTIDGNTMEGGASAEFDLYGGIDDDMGTTNSTTGTTVNGSRKTSSNEKGELSQLASLVGADDFKVIALLGEGNPYTIISGNTAIVKSRTYSMSIFNEDETVILKYGSDGHINKIKLLPDYAPLVWCTRISEEYGAVDKVSSNGLDYDYYALWRGEANAVELICRGGRMTIQITEIS